MNTPLDILEILAAQKRTTAIQQVDSLIAHLQAVRADLDSDKSIAWWEDGFDSRKANAAVVVAVSTQRSHDEAQRALEFALAAEQEQDANRIAH